MEVEMDDVKVQGIFDLLGLLDKDTILRIKEIVKNIDPAKVKQVMDTVTIDDEGYVRVKIDLGIKK